VSTTIGEQDARDLLSCIGAEAVLRVRPEAHNPPAVRDRRQAVEYHADGHGLRYLGIADRVRVEECRPDVLFDDPVIVSGCKTDRSRVRLLGACGEQRTRSKA
jgi:hypothetical protein